MNSSQLGSMYYESSVYEEMISLEENTANFESANKTAHALHQYQYSKVHRNIFRLIILLLIVSLVGCGLSDQGFRFYGEYEVTQSGYRIQIILQGYVEPGDDLTNTARTQTTSSC